MAESKVFRLVDGVNAENVGNAIVSFLKDRKNLIAEGAKTAEGYYVQAKGEGGWKKLAGMDMAIKVQIIQSSDMLTVEVGQGKWEDKIGAAALGAVLFAPLAVTAALGAWNQKKLPQEIFDFTEQFIASGGKSVTVTSNNTINENQVICPNCKAANESHMKFCSECGTKLMKECPNCHAQVALDKKFCTECGTSLVEEETKTSQTCPNCNSSIPEGTKFCPECGSPVNVKKECPNCHTEVANGMKFCSECGTPIE